MEGRTPGPFTVADLNARGELQLLAEYRYEQLENIPQAMAVVGTLSGELWRSPEEFEVRVADELPHHVLRWRATALTAGMATLRCRGELASVSLLACGLDAEADAVTLAAFQRHLLQELRDTGYEPAFDLVELAQRPLLATVNFLSPPDPTDRLVVALADRCFGAAYFRYHRLA